MKILTGTDSLDRTEATVVTVGNFDGVHLGHRKLLDEIVAHAEAAGLRSAVVTFEPHTRIALHGDAANDLLTSFEEKTFLIGLVGVDYLLRLPFDSLLKEKSPDSFVEEILVQKLHVAEWVMGEGHVFGRNRSGSEIFLRAVEDKYHFKTFVAKLLTRNGNAVSSTQIRRCITHGRIAEAVVMLGHPYLISVERTRGVRLGAKLGYPTLNFIKPPLRKAIPPPGVYAAELEYKGIRERGALYFGECPTLHDHRDVHFEFYSFARGKEEIPEGDRALLWLHFYIRADATFSGTDELVKQMAQDVDRIKAFFK